MSVEQPSAPSPPGGPLAAAVRHELAAVGEHWWWFLLLGIAMIVLGTVALGSSFFVSVVTVVFFGFLLLTGGVIQIISAFWAGRWSGLLLHLLIGILYVITGYMIVDAPVESTVQLTLVVALFLLISGLFRIVASLMLKFHDWGWVLLNGIVTLLLGLLIYKHWPYDGLWVIGLFVGIDMIFNGWAWIMLSLGLRWAKNNVGP
ncbi:MAG TPA: DUF308 domain-containing protein [Pirellulales bacterium]|nr:DUF308 domain-containing protein [Pirellulales bacterium]